MVRPNNQTILDHRQRVRRAMVFIDQNLDQVCSTDRLAQEVCLSPFFFNRVFAGCTGETLKQYWLRNRMQHAAHCLMNGNRKVIDIATWISVMRVTTLSVKRFVSGMDFRRGLLGIVR